jgi:nitrate reductase NapA
VGRSARGTWAANALHNLHLVSGRIGRPGDGALCLTSQSGAAAGALDAGTIADELGATAIFRAVERGEVRFLWVQGANPMVSLPHLDRYRKALRDADCFLVVSEAYPTATTEIADLVLPAAMWLERDGVYASAERRVQYFERLLDPPGDATSDAWQMTEVARRLGYGNSFRWDREHEVPSTWTEYSRSRAEARVRLPAFAALRGGTGTLWPSVGGRETKWRYTAAYDPAADRSYGDYDFYGHPDHRAWIWLRPYEPPVEAPDQSYPFWLEMGEVLEHQGTGTMTQRIPALHRALPHSYVELSRADAHALGVRSGDRVRLVSRRGALEVEARVEYRSQPAPGRLFVPTFDSAHPVHRLLTDGGCPLSGEPTAYCAVRVERLTSEGGA